MLINREVLMKILSFHTKEGWLDKARETAKLLAEPDRMAGLNKILAKCVEEGWFDEARKTAKLLAEPEIIAKIL